MPTNRRPRPLHRSAIVFLIATALAAAGCAASPTSPSSTSVSASLTPARSLAGTWSTAVPVTVMQQTDFCGSFQETGRSLWNVTWIVTAAAGFTNVIDVEMRISRGTATRTGCGGDSGYVAPVSPINMRLCVSSSELSRCTGETYTNGVAFGPFTSDLMSLTWSHRECLIYCWGEVTETNALKLTKRS